MPESGRSDKTPTEERVPYGQIFLDDVFLMLTLGVAVPSLLYLLWTMLDLANVPVWK
ncbi:MAG: hypothetical protein HY671_01135 [Chloroflexi bacterium]|nr:hypothetical protein [Chloroflexota bacterium]